MQPQNTLQLKDLESDPILRQFTSAHDPSRPVYEQDSLTDYARKIVQKGDAVVEHQFSGAQVEEHFDRMKDIQGRHSNDPRYLHLGQRTLALMNGQTPQNQADAGYLASVGSPNLDVADSFIDQVSHDKDAHNEKIKHSEIEQQALTLMFRLQISSYDIDQASYFDMLLDSDPQVPPFLKNSKPDNYKWDQWFTDSEQGASNAQVLNFLQWHNQRLAVHNGETSRQWSDSIKVDHVNASHAFIEAGIFESTSNIAARIEPGKVKLASVFSMARRMSLGEVVGDTVYVGHSEYDAGAAHELNHLAFKSGEPLKFEQEWLTEAVVEHAAQVQTNGRDINDTSPVGQSARQAEGSLMHSLIANAGGELLYKDFAQACLGGDQSYQDLKHAVASIYGKDIIGGNESRILKLSTAIGENIDGVSYADISQAAQMIYRDSARTAAVSRA